MGRVCKGCMSFSNDKLYKDLISKFENNPDINIRILSDDKEIEVASMLPIEFICFDGNKEELFISLYGHQTSIFVKGEEIVFIDETWKSNYTASDTYGNVIYEGILNELSHSEMLIMFCEIIECFIGATDIEILEKEISYDTSCYKYKYYKPHDYQINVKNNNHDIKQMVVGNIEINY